MKHKLVLLISLIVLSLSTAISVCAAVKTWTTDADWKEGETQKVEIINTGEPASLILAACPDIKIINIDGNFEDWQGIRGLDTFPQPAEETGDSTLASLDIENIWAANNDKYLYLKYQCSADIDFNENNYYFYLDTDNNSASGFKSSTNDWAVGADYLIQNANLFIYTGTGTDWSWNWINTLNYFIVGNTVEIAIQRKDMDETLYNGEQTNLLAVSETGMAKYDFAPNDKENQVYYYTYAKPIMTVDGDTQDWPGIEPLVIDPQDMVDQDVDIKAGYAVSDENNLYLRLDVYGDINPIGHRYIIYLDTDQDNATGLTYGWWATGADYRIYIDEWSIGLQKFMGTTQSEDTWGWNGQLYQLENTNTKWAWNAESGILECAIRKTDIGENNAANILWRLSGDDSAPYYTNTVTYQYLKSSE
ncbi:MAG: hypothetical protein ABH836_05085 [Candidatus Omnitrophota bacterium]